MGFMPLLMLVAAANSGAAELAQEVPAHRVRPPPQPPAVGAIESGVYRNMFVEAGYSQPAIDAKIDAAVKQLYFDGDEVREIMRPLRCGDQVRRLRCRLGLGPFCSEQIVRHDHANHT